MDDTTLIVIGGLNTDIVAGGVSHFPQPGELVRGRELMIGPGGKSRNIAAMAGRLSPSGQVAMIGRTAEDAYGLWKPPLDALQNAGVGTDFVQVVPLGETDKMPAIALIPVTAQGDNQIFLLPGISDDFSPADIDIAEPLFGAVSSNYGILAVTLECPMNTLLHAAAKAHALGIKVVLDPGGIEPGADLSELLRDLYIIKPNEHETKVVTGITVTDFTTARRAADMLREQGVQNVLITHGEQGAYLFSEQESVHIPIPTLAQGTIKDSTGCGDQATAALCVGLQVGKSLVEAAKLAVLCGTLQFYKSGVQPLTKQEIESQV